MGKNKIFNIFKTNGLNKILLRIDSYDKWFCFKNKGKRKVQAVPQSQTAAHPRHQEEEETDKTKQAQIEKTYEKSMLKKL